MARTVFLHIGAPKTGTSAIQTALVRNRERLEANGLIYPGDNERAWPGEAGSGNALRLAQMLIEERSALWREYIARRQVRRLLRKYPTYSVIYSSEFFSKCSTERLAPFIEFIRENGADVKVIYYVRHLVDHAISTYSQAVRGGGMVQGFSSFIVSHKMRFAGVIKKFSSFVDRKDFILRLYDRERSPWFRASSRRWPATRSMACRSFPIMTSSINL